MSEKRGTALSRLAVGAILSVPVAALAVTAGAEPAAAAPEAVTASCGNAETSAAVASVREQFRGAFTPGAVDAHVTDQVSIICDR